MNKQTIDKLFQLKKSLTCENGNPEVSASCGCGSCSAYGAVTDAYIDEEATK